MAIVESRLISKKPYSVKNGLNKVVRDSSKLGVNNGPTKKENKRNITNELDAK